RAAGRRTKEPRRSCPPRRGNVRSASEAVTSQTSTSGFGMTGKRAALLTAAGLAAGLSLLASGVYAQRFGGFRECSIDAETAAMAGTPREWTFARLAYGGQYGRSLWDVDYPCAEQH